MFSLTLYKEGKTVNQAPRRRPHPEVGQHR